jgi:FixJ family two-component response regulator
MPEMNGHDLAENVRVLRPGLKVLFMSGYTDEAISNQSVLDSNSVFLSKPASIKDLLLKIRDLLDRESAISQV